MVYIDKEKLIDQLTEIRSTEESQGYASFVLTRMINCAENMVPENVREQVHGMWIRNKDYGICRCSVCGELFPYADYVLKWNFCPSCGASMKR